MQGGRILIVDDEPMVRETIAQVLRDEGYTVEVADDGRDALIKLDAHRPDAVLLDLMMPGMNGRQFLQVLREDPAYHTIPVLIMTAVHGLEINLASIGASEVVEKPFQADDLLNKVALAVYRSRDADGAQPFTPVPAEPEPVVVDRGIVLLVERDRARLQRLDLLLSQRGYTVVSMTRAGVQLSRLARALKPLAVLLELASEGVLEIVRELHDVSGPIAVLLYSRDMTLPASCPDALARATDAELVQFVERQN